MRRFLMIVGIMLVAALLGFVLWYGPWSAGWFSGKAWEWRDFQDEPEQKTLQKTNPDLQGIHPVLDGFRLVGGVVDGRWRSRTEVVQLLKGQEQYRTYSRLKYLGETGSAKISQENYLSGDTGYYVELNQYKEGQVLAIDGKWNPFPRQPRIRKNFGKLMPLVNSWLVKRKINPNGFSIKDAIDVDLEGDGQVETVLYATNVLEKDIDAAAEGINEQSVDRDSYILLYRNGQMDPLILSQAREGTNDYELNFVADVDGDGTMEVKVTEININSVSVEGFALYTERILKVKVHEVRTMTEINANPV